MTDQEKVPFRDNLENDDEVYDSICDFLTQFGQPLSRMVDRVMTTYLDDDDMTQQKPQTAI